MNDLTELNIIVTPALPLTPTLAEDTVRAVRHGLANVLEWLGEDVGPKPGVKTSLIRAGGTLFVSAELHNKLKDQA